MNESKDLECPTTKEELFNEFKRSLMFEVSFMVVIERGIIDKELYINELQSVCQRYKGKFFVSPGGNYIVSLGSTWEGLKL
jgi:hypothetical protein